MNPDSPTFPPTLGDLMDQLKAWRTRLLSELEDRVRRDDTHTHTHIHTYTHTHRDNA